MEKTESDGQIIEALERTHQEAQATLENQLHEVEQIRNSAQKTFRTSVLLLGVIITAVTAFRGPITEYFASPVSSILPTVLASVFVLSGGFALLVSPILAIWSVKDVDVQTGVSALDLNVLSEKSKSGNHHAELTEVGWYRMILTKYSTWIGHNHETIETVTTRLRICHSVLTYAPVSISIGIWLMNV